MHFVLPDPLIWQAGNEYAMDAFALLKRRGFQFTAHFRDHGPLLESLAFLRYTYELQDHVQFTRAETIPGKQRIIVAPRIKAFDSSASLLAMIQSEAVVTSDPAIDRTHPRLQTFNRRNSEELADVLSKFFE